MSIEQAAKMLSRRGVWRESAQALRAQLADISEYLGTKDPIELGAAYLLEINGYERGREQLSLELIPEEPSA